MSPKLAGTRVPGELPEEFAPTGPRPLLPVRPAPPVRPRLMSDEARWVLRLALLCALCECAAWVWLPGAHGAALSVWAAARVARPLWARLGAVAGRALVAGALLAAALALQGVALRWPSAALVGAALPALGDLLLSAAADAITVERRAAAVSWLEMGQGAGALAGVLLAAVAPAPGVAAVALIGAGIFVPDLRDRGTPRSAWPLAAYGAALRTPLGAQLAALALLGGALAGSRGPWPLLAVLGMALAARLEARVPNAVWLPRAAVAVAALSLAVPELRLFALGALFSALPGAGARGAAELQRPLVSSMAWAALSAGAALRW